MSEAAREPAPSRRRPLELARASVLLVLGLGALVAVSVSLFGVAGLETIAPRPAPSLDAAAYRVSLSVPRLLLSLGLVAGMGLFVAGITAWITGRDFTGDLGFVADGIDAMVTDNELVASIPLRTLDELGQLIRSFEDLRRDFDEALARERRLRREVERADAAKAEFLHAVSHELRTPLNSILGFADILLEEMDGPLGDEQKEDLRIIRSAGQHLIALFNDVLDLSAAATDQLRLERAAIAVGPLMEEVAAEMRGQRKGKAVEIVVDVPADLPLADADPTRLRQVLTNLASNALKFTDEGEVRFSAREGEGAELVLAVSDTGVGIPEEQQAEVCQEFGQVWGGDEESARAARRRRGGAGLGLAITRRLVELHGGSVRLESTVGEGSRFELLWPRAEEEAP
ncbi:MAG TPA: HAMP domain-containing sensor histidine kinase [Polyangiaceae bacterium LLY-WYZ-15_(1-7)]|nr:HAMP domain-containing sensor histidine kinase [Polyangiaceae bacterium LLY-WYZ-15_(1-7)]